MHKQEWTQHQYRFEAVIPSKYFPNGAKFTYRKFSSDRVVIIDKMPKLLARSPIGMRTGLEPRTVLSQWYPTPDLYPDRSVEGTYLLNTVPYLDRCALYMAPKALVKDCHIELDDLKGRINTHYTRDLKSLQDWNDWFKLHAPIDDDVNKYIKTHSYKCPLISYFKEGIEHKPSWKPQLPATSLTVFPKHVVVALPSIKNRFDSHGTTSAYMTISMEDENTRESSVAGRYSMFEEAEYKSLRSVQQAPLRHQVGRKLKESGGKHPLSGTIEKLSAIIHDSNMSFYGYRLEPFEDPEHTVFIDTVFDMDVGSYEWVAMREC